MPSLPRKLTSNASDIIKLLLQTLAATTTGQDSRDWDLAVKPV